MNTIASTQIEQVRSRLGAFTVNQLRKARVICPCVPDPSNPGGYYDRWVILEFRSRFLGILRRKILYFEPTAFDDDNQMRVNDYVRRLIAAVTY
ncbi:hypothetical protein FJY93_01165 [Candidatus Kaiserbacteria bacterium]|nr:hypothetical protein [Candidatus Kaiserbacteria bacterium]